MDKCPCTLHVYPIGISVIYMFSVPYNMQESVHYEIGLVQQMLLQIAYYKRPEIRS